MQAALTSMDAELAQVSAVMALEAQVDRVRDEAYGLATVIDNVVIVGEALQGAEQEADEIRGRLDTVGNADVSAVLIKMSEAQSQRALDGLWQEFARLPGLDPASASLGERAFAVGAQRLALEGRLAELASELDDFSGSLDGTLTSLLAAARANSSETLQSSVSLFDRGRVLLAVISLVSVAVATIAAWLLVGNGLVRPLSRLSDRMRGMAGGDLETPVPGVGRRGIDEIGELAEALEVFRQQALEVQRLNLVEKLYGELQEANAELQRMQDRLVAQEKLAALGELVSGVAHEISNPLNFVQNFAEVSVEMYEELTEVLGSYEESMTEEDRTAIHDLEEDLADSLERIRANGGRALAIVERMRGLGVVGGDLTPVDLNSAVHGAVEVGTSAFLAQWPDLRLDLEYDLDASVGEVSMVEHDFGEAIVNLVSNACYAMWLKQSQGDDGEYRGKLSVSSSVEGKEVNVRVRDNGTGISEDVVGHIFNPFFSTREGALGAGLGLPIAADVARRAGGNLTVETEVGQYAEFIFSLPCLKEG